MISVQNQNFDFVFLGQSILRYQVPLEVFHIINSLYENNKNNFNTPHIHQLSNFSGVYYVEVSDKNGELIFFRGDKSNQILEIQSFIKDKDFYEEYHVKPLKNQLIIFPSHLMHMVKPHFEEKPRISVSFNITIERHG